MATDVCQETKNLVSGSPEGCHSATIWFHPYYSGNPYQKLFYEALAPHGFSAVPIPTINDSWIEEHARPGDIVHIHWPEDIWRTRGHSVFKVARRLGGCYRFLRHCRRLGVSTAWTVHNLQHHEGSGLADHVGYRLLSNCCDRVICHSQIAASEVRRLCFDKTRIVAMDHGLYSYQLDSSFDEKVIRKKYGIPQGKRVIAAIGNVRAYKNLELLLDVAPQLSKDWHVLVAGHAKEFDYGAQVQQRAGVNVSVAIGFIPENEFAALHSIADVIALPYRQVTTSGAMLAAWSMGKPVITSNQPLFLEYLNRFGPPGIQVCRTATVAEVREKCMSIASLHPEKLRTWFSDVQAHLNWDRVVKPVAEAFRQDSITAAG